LQAVIANATALVLFKIIIIRRRKKHQQQNANAIALVLLKNNTEKNTSNKKGHPLQRQIACVCVRIYRIVSICQTEFFELHCTCCRMAPPLLDYMDVSQTTTRVRIQDHT
jgi:hypothetical protein